MTDRKGTSKCVLYEEIFSIVSSFQSVYIYRRFYCIAVEELNLVNSFYTASSFDFCIVTEPRSLCCNNPHPSNNLC